MSPVSPLRHHNRGNLIIRHSKINDTRISGIRINGGAVTAAIPITTNGVPISLRRSAISRVN